MTHILINDESLSVNMLPGFLVIRVQCFYHATERLLNGTRCIYVDAFDSLILKGENEPMTF